MQTLQFMRFAWSSTKRRIWGRRGSRSRRLSGRPISSSNSRVITAGRRVHAHPTLADGETLALPAARSASI